MCKMGLMTPTSELLHGLMQVPPGVLHIYSDEKDKAFVAS